jgi:hypothetical protein
MVEDRDIEAAAQNPYVQHVAQRQDNSERHYGSHLSECLETKTAMPQCLSQEMNGGGLQRCPGLKTLHFLELTLGFSQLPVTPDLKQLTSPFGLCGHICAHIYVCIWTYTQKYFIKLYGTQRLEIAK